MRNRNTLEFIGLWEALNNPNFNRVQFGTFRSEADMLNITEPVNQYREEKTTGRGGASWFCMADQIRKVVTRAFQRCALVLRGANTAFTLVEMPPPPLAPELTPGVALKQRVARRLSVGIRIVPVVVLVFSANAIVARSYMSTRLRR